ncbi:hypothetical protein Celaphus_00003291, partial [Cervus elaphus hippelaphus]
MLVLMLVAATTFWLCPLVKAQPLCRFGLPFDYDRTLDILIVPGQKGILIFWFQKNLLVSRNSGQLVESVQVREGQRILYNSILKANITIHSVAAREFENKMYTIDMNSQLELTALMIPRPGTLPVPLDEPLRARGASLGLAALQPRAVLTQGLRATVRVMVSNPHSLGLQAVIYEDGYTYDGNTKHRLNISLKQQHHWGRANPNFTSSIKRPTISTITLDIANKEISCVDLKPLTALISVGCDLEKKIVIQNELSACHHGVLDPVALQDNYSYIIERWREGKFQEVVEAEYVLLEMNGLFTYTYSLTAGMAGCSAQPQNWTTVTEMAGNAASFSWDREPPLNAKGANTAQCFHITSRARALPASEAGSSTDSRLLNFTVGHHGVCRRAPTALPDPQGQRTRLCLPPQNYMSCHDPDYHEPLRWPDVPYQILGGPTENKVVFDQRNGIYIFFISIVDPSYSYCHLETTFSVYVYGAFPLSIFPPEITIVLLTVATLLSVWLAYMIPQLLHMEQGLEVSGFWARLYQRCRRS